MMLDMIERLRQEPLEVRRQVVRVWTFWIVLCIALIYIGYLVVRPQVMNAVRPSDETNLVPPYASTPQ